MLQLKKVDLNDMYLEDSVYDSYSNRQVLSLINLNRRYKDRIKYLEYSNRLLRNEINNSKTGRFLTKLKNIFK